MKIRVLGAAREVGRSAFQINCDGTNFLLDYGVMFGKPRGTPPTYPLHVKPRDIDSVTNSMNANKSVVFKDIFPIY